MILRIIVSIGLVFSVLKGATQQRCGTAEYFKQQLSDDPTYRQRLDEVENFTRQKTGTENTAQRTGSLQGVIKIPVVFHVLYHLPEENITAAAIQQQIDALNRDFRKRNNDTVNTPAAFKSVAADMEIEFYPATMDPQGRSTSGIVRKYTPVTQWYADDKMKFTSGYGDDAWDSRSYLNIWICNLKSAFGYSNFPGVDNKIDGIVIASVVFSTTYGSVNPVYGRTLVHEVGHWLNLRHLWGDTYCGDDYISDTPKQAGYTPDCPSGIRISCGNSPAGDMYMNFMDFTDDRCMNLFTLGQKQRARALFEPGGPRNSLLSSKGLNISTIQAAEVPDFYPQWLHAQVYPNPATSSINIYFEYDERWLGKELLVVDMTGRVVIKKIINSKIQNIDISRLPAGVYFIRAEKDGEKIISRFVRL